MPHAVLGSLLRYLRQFRDLSTADATDGELLRRYASGDEAAFAELVRRHAPLVWGVCRRLLNNEQDTEDAFQAAFLVLLRKAESLRAPQSLAAFLHGVAYRIAQKARVIAQRRRYHEAQTETRPAGDPMAAVEQRELRVLLDEELANLPEKYRAPLVLCYLEGKSYIEAARQLGWRDGTVCGRLARARELLRQRLIRRGLTLSGAAFVAMLTEPANAPAATVAAVSRMVALFALGQTAGSGVISAPVATLAQGVLQAMGLAKLKAMTVLVGIFCILAGGVGLAAHRLWTATEAPLERTEKPSAANGTEQPSKEPLARTDHYGDPLPAGAVARIGTVRFREGNGIFAVAYSPDGKTLASGTGELRENRLRLWDAGTGKQLRVLQPELNQIKSLAFSPNGKLLASLSEMRGPASGGVHVWDTASGKEILTLRRAETEGWAIAFSSDGRRLAAGGWGTLYFWDTTSGKETLQIKDPKQSIFAFALSPDGKTLATADHQYTIGLWDAATGKELRRLFMPKIARKFLRPSVAFSPDSQVVAGGSSDGAVYSWDTATGRERLRIPGHNKWRNASGFSQEGPALVVFTPDGRYLAAGNEGIVFDAATGKERCRLQDFHRWIRSLVFSPDGKTLAGEGDHRVRFWDAATGKEIFKDTAHQDTISSIDFSPDGMTLYTADGNTSVGAWETATGRERFRFQGPGRSAFDWHRNEIAVASDGKTAAAWLDGAIYTWNVRKPKPVQVLSDTSAGFDSKHGLAFSPQGRVLAAAWSYKHKQIRLWSNGIEKEPLLLQPQGDSGNNGLVFSADGKTLASGSSDGTARLWDVATGKDLRVLPGFPYASRGGPGTSVFSLAFSPDSQTLALGGSDGTIGLWDKGSGRELRRFVSSPRGFVKALAFSPDGKTVAAGYEDGTVRFWETITGKLRREWATHTGTMLALAFSPDGKFLASAGSDTAVLIWTADEQTNPRDLSAKDLEALWNDLAADDAVRAYRAIGILGAAARQRVPFLRAHVHPVAAVDAKHLAQLIADLDDARFEVREKAAAELAKDGDCAEPALRKTLAAQPSLEVRRRIETILAELQRPPSAEQLRQLRAVEVLERVQSPEARAALEELAQGAPERDQRAKRGRLCSA